MLSTLLLALVVSGTPQESVIPEGTVLRVVLNEKISTKTLQENDPVLFSLAVDDLVSPVAFCPDTVLRYVFDASTHPLEVYQASQWMQQPRSGTPPRWDASIQALAGYPDLFRQLANDVEWTEKLGNVYRVRPNDVKDAVQRIRAQPRVVASCASSTFQQR